MDKLLDRILTDQAVITALTTVILALCGYIVSLFNKMKVNEEIKQTANEEALKSIKRGSLRNEYLQIYNSKEFTYEQKYGMTRDIIKSYKKYNGNHYISTLDAELKEKSENEAKQQNV